MKGFPMCYPLICAFAMSGFLAACMESDGGKTGPMPGTPEAILQSKSAVWKANEKRSFVFEAQEWRLDDTTTYTCESRNGAVGICVETRHCCGELSVVDTVSGYASPTELLARLRTDIEMLKSTDGETSLNGFTANRRGANGVEIAAGISAAFHPDLGYPRSVVWFGASPDSGVNITRLEFK